jgi:ankyrin repeat protein
VRARNTQAVRELVQQHSAAPNPRNSLDINARAEDGNTALHWCVATGFVEMTASLANLPGIDLSARDCKGRTPLHLAALHAHESPEHLQCTFLLAELGGAGLSEVADDDGATALHLAAEKGTKQAAAILIHSGVKVDCTDHDGMTSLQLGLSPQSRLPRLPPALMCNVTEVYRSPSSAAARAGQLDVLRLLLSARASITHVDFDGTTALAHASTKGHVEIVQALIAAGADPAASDLSSASPLKMAIRHGHLDVSSILIRHEYAVDLCDCGVASCEWLTTLCANAQEVSVKEGRDTM